jgi:hypothetical protein
MVDIKKIEEAKNKIANYISEHEHMFDYMDLKMHKAFYWVCDNAANYGFTYDEAINIFYAWCEFSYEDFVYALKENYDIDFNKMYHQLGSTSKFYLHDGNVIATGCVLGLALETNVNNVIDYMLEYNFSAYATLDDIYDDDYTDKEELADYIINDCYNDFIEWCKPIEIVYDCIKSAKDCQVDWIKEEFEYRKEEVDYTAEQEAIALAEYNKKHPLSTDNTALMMCDELLKSGHKLQIELDKNGNVKILDCMLKKC